MSAPEMFQLPATLDLRDDALREAGERLEQARQDHLLEVLWRSRVADNVRRRAKACPRYAEALRFLKQAG